MSEMDAIRQKKRQKAEEEQTIRAALSSLLEPDAYSRLMMVAQANPGLFEGAVKYITYLAQSGRMNGKLNEAQIRQLLLRLSPRPRETKIEFRRKGE